MMPPPIRRIALTGGIASGKSLAADYLARQGVPVIDADDVVHRLLREDEALKARIRSAFGEEVFGADGTIDRQKLGLAVFGDADKRKMLEGWIHPQVREAIEAFYREQTQAGKRLGVSVIPLLFESGLENHYDEVWLIETGEEHQLARLTEKRVMRPEDARARMQSQMPMAEKLLRAGRHPKARVLQNTGEPVDLFRQLDELLM